STVNWSACIPLSNTVRREFADEHGLSYFLSPEYQAEVDKVLHRMGASTDHIVHNQPNRLVMQGARKCGMDVRAVMQNSGGKRHSCGYCANGCRYGEKMGSMNSWLVDAAL